MLKLTDFIIDCPDPMKLAAFYSKVTGRAVPKSDDDWAGIQYGEVELAFQRVDDYRLRTGPRTNTPSSTTSTSKWTTSSPKGAASSNSARRCGRTSSGTRATGGVYTDPIGHPFCLCRNKGVTWTDQGLIWPKSGCGGPEAGRSAQRRRVVVNRGGELRGTIRWHGHRSASR